MRFQILLLILLAVFTVTGVPSAHAAADTSAVVSRMDIIIKQMEALKAEFAALASSVGTTPAPSGAVLGAQSKTIFTLSLANGETNSDIEKIQELLATDPLIYPYGVTSGFYGPKTEEGIKNLQTRFNLDPVGVVGPATKALLELFMSAYPDGKYPADVLKKKPTVLGASTSVPQTPTPTAPVVSGNPLLSVIAERDNGEAEVEIEYTDGTSKLIVVDGDSEDDIVGSVSERLKISNKYVSAVFAFGNNDDDEDEDEDDDDFNVDVEIDDEEVTVSFEYDGDDYEVEVDSTDEDDVLDEVADELDEDLEDVDEDLVEAIEDSLDEALDEEDEGSDEIESITASIADGEAQIEVEYGNGDDEDFTVEEDKEAEIIEEIADELNIDEGEVEDLIEFEYEDIEEINVDIEDGKAIATVEFEDGTTKRVKIDSDDEDDIIGELAEELDEDEDDVEEWTKFDYLD